MFTLRLSCLVSSVPAGPGVNGLLCTDNGFGAGR